VSSPAPTAALYDRPFALIEKMRRLYFLILLVTAAVEDSHSATSSVPCSTKLWTWGTPSGFKNLWTSRLSKSVRTRITATESAFLLGTHNLFMFWEHTEMQCSSSAYTQCDIINGSDPANQTLQVYSAPFAALPGMHVWGASYSQPVPSWLWPRILELLANDERESRGVGGRMGGVCLDDYPYDNLTSLAAFRDRVLSAKRTARLWSTFYTSDLQRPNVGAYLKLIDHPILWTWRAEDLNATIGHAFPAFEVLTPPGRMLGLYAYDFGGGPGGHGGEFPRDAMARQLEWARELLMAGRISGVAFEGLFDLGLEAVDLLRAWVSMMCQSQCPHI
jgi:hypothetical protein